LSLDDDGNLISDANLKFKYADLTETCGIALRVIIEIRF